MADPRPHRHMMGAHYVLFLVSVACPVTVWAADKTQDFLDEKGRPLYSIDAQDIVTMFETDALDNTLSVTRGPRESMMPRITEISPPTIETGKTTVVVFKGDNLVGAKFSSSVPGLKFRSTTPRATVAGVSIEVAPNVKPQPVTIAVATPIGNTTTKLTLTKPQVGLSARSTGRKPDLKDRQPVKPEECPEGMVGIPSSTGGFCIDIDGSGNGNWFIAEMACSYKSKRLCWAEEWELACKEDQMSGLGLRNMPGGWEWTRTSVYVQAGAVDNGGVSTEKEDWMAVIKGQPDCASKDKKDPWIGGARPGRCCK